jgi:glycine hydroxymethyltransferase
MLDSIGVTLNFNAIPNDPRPPMHTSGLRIGTPAMTTQGMKEAEARQAAALIARALNERNDPAAVETIEGEIRALAEAFPPYPADWAGHV